MIWLLACAGEDPAAPVADAGASVFTYVGDATTLDGGGSTGASFTWDPGDGTAPVTAAEPVTTHVFDHPGHFTAILRASDDVGRVDVASVAVTAVYPPLATAPRASATLVMDDAEQRLFAVLPDFDAVAVVDRASRRVSHLATCDRPRSVSWGDGLLAVACEGDAVDLFVDGEAPAIHVALPYGSAPFGVVVGDDGVYATLQATGSVATIARDGTIASIDAVGPDLRGLAWWEGGLVATRHRSADEGGSLYVIADAVAEHALAPDPGPDSDTNARGVPTYLQRVSVSPDGRVAYTAGLKANIARGLARDGRALDHQTTVRADLRAVSLPDGAPLGQTLFDDRDFIAALALAPRGDWLYVVSQGAETVEVLDPWSLVRVGGLHPDVRGPDGLIATSDGELWVLGSLSRELVAFDRTVPTTLGEERARIDLRAGVAEVLPLDVLAGQVVFTRSADPRLTKSGYVSCASCHLDGDADLRTWDFTDRGEGLRNTISLQGHAGAAPIHWSANFDEVADFENDIRGPMAGAGFLAEDDWAATSDPLGEPKAGLSPELDALAAYVTSLSTFPRSPFRQADGSHSAAASRGEALFLSSETGCATCHVPPSYTDSAFLSPGEPLLHDVGTLTAASGSRLHGPLTGLDTPSLRGTFATGPWLHDGSAPTLRAVLVDHNPDDHHGVTSTLDPTELDDLVAFLASIE